MIKAEQCCLVLIDVQEKLAQVIDRRERVISNCAVLVQIAKALGIPILWCQQNPAGLGETVAEVRAYLSGLKPIDKFSFSCCGQQEFLERLEFLKIDTAVLCGIETHVCVFQTASDLLKHGLAVHIIADAVSSRTADNHNIGLGRMAAEGATISSTEMFLFEMLGSAKHEKFKELARRIK